MAVSASIAVGAAIVGGVAAHPMAPKPPKMPAAPASEDPASKASAAAKRQQQKNTAAYGRSDTILTGPQGVLGSSSTAGGGKTMLGA